MHALRNSSNSKREFNIKYLKYAGNYAVSCWLRGCSSPVDQWAGSVHHQQLTGNMKAATKQLPILEILLEEAGGCSESHNCVTNRLKRTIVFIWLKCYSTNAGF